MYLSRSEIEFIIDLSDEHLRRHRSPDTCERCKEIEDRHRKANCTTCCNFGPVKES